MDRVSLVIEKELKMKPKDNVIAKYLGISPTNFANLKNSVATLDEVFGLLSGLREAWKQITPSTQAST
jgi:flagellin-specific chaperone FliS